MNISEYLDSMTNKKINEEGDPDCSPTFWNAESDVPNMVRKEICDLETTYPQLAQAFKTLQFASKCVDYGLDNMRSGTDLSTEDQKNFALTGIWYRMQDKMNRWKNSIVSGHKLNNESLLDTFQDLANYAMIAVLVEKGLWKK